MSGGQVRPCIIPPRGVDGRARVPVAESAMRRILALLLATLALGACVSGQDASTGAVRFLNGVPDAPRMNMYVDDRLRATGFDYTNGSSYTAVAAGTYDVRISGILPASEEEDDEEIYSDAIRLDVNDEVTLAVIGASGAEETLQIPSRTRGVPTGKTRVNVLHGSPGVPDIDVYVTEPDATLAASTPFASALGYREWTPQSEITGGNRRIRITTAGDPDDVLFDSGTVFFTLGGTLFLAVLPSTAPDAAQRPVAVTLMTGSGSGVLGDQDSQVNVRTVNASPGAYTLDAFLNDADVDSERQTCDPLTEEEGTLLELCALPYESIGTFATVEPGTYDVKAQITGDADVDAKVFAGVLGAGNQVTLAFTGLVADTATATEVGLLTLISPRRIATVAQLRIITLSLAAEDAIEGDPTTDRIELYVTDPGADLAEEDPDVSNLRFGSDTGYSSLVPGDYDLTIAESDTADTDAPPQPLLTESVTLAAGGVYTLLVVDTVGGVQPLKFLVLDDDPTP